MNSIDHYMKQVDLHLGFTGLSHDDLVDIDYYSMFEDGVPAKEAAMEAMAASGANDDILGSYF